MHRGILGDVVLIKLTICPGSLKVGYSKQYIELVTAYRYCRDCNYIGPINIVALVDSQSCFVFVLQFQINGIGFHSLEPSYQTSHLLGTALG